MENEVHEALVVMDAETGKVLNYRQLRQSPKHKETWNKTYTSEFGRLENGVGGRNKGTNMIKFICKCDVPSIRMKDVTYRQLYVASAPKKPKHIERNLWSEAT